VIKPGTQEFLDQVVRDDLKVTDVGALVHTCYSFEREVQDTGGPPKVV
jgi:hypothetical protein